MKLTIKDYIIHYRYVIAGCLVVIILGFCLFFLCMPKKNYEEPLLLAKEESKEEKVKTGTIQIDVKGAVKNPGVIQIPADSRVSDAISKSGGLREDADITTINLSKKLVDENVIIIYTKNEITEMRKGSTSVKYIEKECICPKIENNACIEKPITNETQEPSKPGDTVPAGKISLNKATLQVLETLPGIGEAKAKLIIEYRNKTPFKTIEELKNVKGIGDTVFDKIKDLIIP